MADRESARRLFLHARRESVLVLVVWLAALIWTVGYCVRHGYTPAAAEAPTWWGIPEWVFLGIVVPWLVCGLISGVFCFVIMQDDDLGAEAEETTEADHGA